MHRLKTFGFAALLCAVFCSGIAVAVAPLGTSGTKLVGTGSIGTSLQGSAVALSGDGYTAMVGGLNDNSFVGAVWVYAARNGGWVQVAELLGNGEIGAAQFGSAVALSADGNTAIIGAHGDGSAGAVWVYVRNGGVWTQQGPKLIGSGASGASGQGGALALSSDGNTAIIGGGGDNGGVGAAWIFTRSAGVWTQQGPKLVGGGSLGLSQQGAAVALSADGNTAIVGGPSDGSSQGAAWVFVRSAGAWTQQGSKLLANDRSGLPRQGSGVGLSADGNTAIVGGPGDSGVGAAWIYTRSNAAWGQESKLVGTGSLGAGQGFSTALSADGNTAIVGSPSDSSNTGAVWFHARTNGLWKQQGVKLVGSGASGAAAQGAVVALSADATTALVGAQSDNTSVGAAWIFGGEPCTFDLDGNGSVDALTDGLVVLRALFGLTGNAVTNAAIGSGSPKRTTWPQIQSFMNGSCQTNLSL